MLAPEALMLVGFAAGLMLGLALGAKRFGCLSLFLIPVGSVAYVSWWLGQNPELLRSTSGLEYLFVPLPPLIGALAGYGLVAFAREWRA